VATALRFISAPSPLESSSLTVSRLSRSRTSTLREPQRLWRTAIVGPRDEFIVMSGACENNSVREKENEGCKCANSSHCEALARRQCEIFTQSAGTSARTAADVSSECPPNANSCAEFSH
jgi:hypothetical protein